MPLPSRHTTHESVHRREVTNHEVDREIDIDHELTKGFASRAIALKAKQLIGRAGFTKADREDLQQEMKLRIWQRLAQFDPTKAHWNAFVVTVVERHAATILQRARRQKRLGGDTPVSLSELVEDCDNEIVELADTIGPQHRENTTGRWVDGFENQVDLKITVDELLATLPKDLRRLCTLLKSYNVQDSAARMGVHRTTAFRMLCEIRSIFLAAGFEDFLPNCATRDDETR
ncbi:MAG: sigma factor [Planctomycetaceae bacterium]